MKEKVGDFRRGFVGSAWGTFEILGNRERTLNALLNGLNQNRKESSHPELDMSDEPRFVPVNTIHGAGMVAVKYVK